MDAFKLLTRATNLRNGRTLESALENVNTDEGLFDRGCQPANSGDPVEDSKPEPFSSRRKRKRESNEISNTSPTLTGHSIQDGQEVNVAKELKSYSLDKESQPQVNDSSLSEEAIRAILKKHQVKVVDLAKLYSSSDHNAGNKSQKARKRAAQVFPSPLTSFSELTTRYNCSRALMTNISNQGFSSTTAVQLGTIPLQLEPRESDSRSVDSTDVVPDLLTIAPTGSGKTLAYMIPLVDKIIRRALCSCSHCGPNEGARFADRQ
jgi:ATP-dependent RNA helicase DDX52/ROK1